MRNHESWRHANVTATLLVLAVSGLLRADDQPAKKAESTKALDKQIRAALPRVINSGADLFNEGDRAGCYHLYLGSLLTLRPLLEHHRDLQKAIDTAMADADRQKNVGERAFALREGLDKIREKLKPADAGPAALWDRLGGEAKVKKVVDDFVALAAKDPKVNFDRSGKIKFDAVKMADLKDQLVAFISTASGGPLKYTGKSMKDAHKGMGITAAQFDASAADLKKALEQNGAKPADVEAVLKAVEGTRKDIVEGR